MKLDELPDRLRDAVTVKRVYGDPYQVDGVTVIPVARAGGAGGAGEGGPADSGGRGIGLGFGATPIGVYVIKDGEVSFVPTVDPLGMATRAMVVAVAALLAWRSVARARQRRYVRQAKYGIG